MFNKYDLGNFDAERALEPYPGVVYAISRRGDTYDEDGGRNRHPWRWEVRVRDCLADWDDRHRGSGWTDGLGLGHEGFPTVEAAYDHMRRNARAPEDYAREAREREERAPKTAEDLLGRGFGRKDREG